MIRRKVDAVLLLRDGFTGRVVARDVLCRVDGQPLRRPLWKQDGYLVLHDLAPGPHRVTLTRPGFCPACLTVEAGRGFLEKTITLQPGEDYPFPAGTADLTIRAPGLPDGRQVWVGMESGPALKLAQGKETPPGLEVRLFCQGLERLLPVPGTFLVADPNGAELVSLRALRGGVGELEQPMALPHGRGVVLVGAQSFAVDGGVVRMRFRQGGIVWMFCGGSLARTQIREGSQEFIWRPEGER